MFDAKRDKRAKANDPNRCRGRWSVCGGRNVNIDNVRWHICNACSINRAQAMARGEVRPNATPIVAKATTTKRTTTKRATKRATPIAKSNDEATTPIVANA